MAREAECGNRALQPVYGNRLELLAGDLRDANMQSADVIAMLDVLHYLPFEDQDRLLDRIRAALDAGSLFVTRIGNASGGLRFELSHITDRVISIAQGHRLPRLWCRPLAAWIAALESRRFEVQSQPMSRGTPFANVMLLSRAL
jgi:O-methyltransferase involved in polyketide biosynthesis